MAFHTAVWLDNYVGYVRYLDDLNSISQPQDYSQLEWADMHPGILAGSNTLMKIHSYLQGPQDDINLFSYMVSQFSWDKKVVTFYRHHADDFESSRITKNAIGR